MHATRGCARVGGGGVRHGAYLSFNTGNNFWGLRSARYWNATWALWTRATDLEFKVVSTAQWGRARRCGNRPDGRGGARHECTQNAGHIESAADLLPVCGTPHVGTRSTTPLPDVARRRSHATEKMSGTSERCR